MDYFEDVTIGSTITIGQHLFTAEEIKSFARRYDPQPFHLDELAAAQSHFGALCASGWHTAAIWMKLTIAFRRKQQTEREALGLPFAQWGPSPGFRELKWLKPVYAGDTLTFSAEAIDKRASKTRPAWGLLFSRNVGVNQHGETAFSFVSSVFVERRPA